MAKGGYSRGPHNSLRSQKTCPRDSDYYMCVEFEKLQTKNAELKEDNIFLRRQEKNTNARIERLLRKLTKPKK